MYPTSKLKTGKANQGFIFFLLQDYLIGKCNLKTVHVENLKKKKLLVPFLQLQFLVSFPIFHVQLAVFQFPLKSGKFILAPAWNLAVLILFRRCKSEKIPGDLKTK